MMRIGLFLASFLVSSTLISQNEVDALRYSFIDFNGTARYTSMGGAFGALGGDLSSIYSNPAGIAVYRSNEISFSPGFSINSSRSNYNGISSNDNKLNFNIGNAGLALVFPGREGSKIKFGHFGVNYNRIQDFNNHYTINGENNSSSLSDVFANQALGIPSGELGDYLPFTSFLAWETFLINPGAGSNEYVSEYPGGNIRQTKTIENRGRVSQTDLAFGLNYDNKLYAGASIGLQNIYYEEETVHRETVLEGDTDLSEWSYFEELETRGSGVNFNIGLIYRLVDQVRIGAAWHSPIYYFEIEDLWSSRLSTNFSTGETYLEQSIVGFNIYDLTTPSRYVGSIAVVVGKKGLISADYEYLNYANSRLSPAQGSPSDFTDANNEISNQYTNAANIRIGGEYRLLPLSLRGGFAYYQCPYRNGFVENSPDVMVISAGFGLRIGNYSYFDVALKHSRFTNDYYLYDPALVSLTDLEHSNNTLRFTYGYRF